MRHFWLIFKHCVFKDAWADFSGNVKDAQNKRYIALVPSSQKALNFGL